jgi:dihydroxy-acid dehydratase
MEDFYYAGGLPVVIQELRDLLHMDAFTVTGRSVQENTSGAQCYNRDVIAPLDQPFQTAAGMVVLRGNLCERGAVLKPSAASPHLLKHRGRAIVFDNIEDYHARIDDPDLEVDESNVLVLKNVGPKGYPGMPEVGNMGLPKKLLLKGVSDMVRISDGRMSGTAFGAVVLHVAPEAAAGGTLALVENGDWIELDVPQRRLHLDVESGELSRRRAAWRPPVTPHAERGYPRLYVEHVEQADLGVDLDFLRGKSGAYIPRDSH